MRKAILLGTAALAVAGAAFATPASAVPLGGDTTVTFAVGTAGGVSILPAPAVVALPSGNSEIGALTSVVTDLRVAGGGWTDTISSTDFALVGATSPSGTSLVPATAAKIYTTSATVAIPGTATITNLHTDLASALSLATTGQELLSATTTNANVTTLVSTLQIDVTGKAVGAYTGTITQTVS
jgi:hypothetical protein